MGKFYCGVPQCKSYAGTTKVKFHLFPKDPVLGKKWDEVLKRPKPHSCHTKICELHFTETDYLKSSISVVDQPKRKKLKSDAVPSQNLPRLNPDGSVIKIKKKLKKETLKKDRTIDSTVDLGENFAESGFNSSSDSMDREKLHMPYYITDTGDITCTTPEDISEYTIPLYSSVDLHSDQYDESGYMEEFSEYSDTQQDGDLLIDQCEPKYATLQPVPEIFLS